MTSKKVPYRDMWAGGKGPSSKEIIEIDKGGVVHSPEHPWRAALEGTILKMHEEIERLKSELAEAQAEIKELQKEKENEKLRSWEGR